MSELRQLKEGDLIESFLALQDASLQTSARGSYYIRMTLADATASLPANFWDATPDIYASIKAGEVVKVRAVAETYRGSLQLKVDKIRPAHESEVDPSSFLPSTLADVIALENELRALIASIADADYKRLLEAFFNDPEIWNKFKLAPAAKQNHHAYLGGLLEHTMSLARLADMFCKTSQTPLNRDLLLTGAFLHDIGKIDELSVSSSISYSDVGSLIGHLNIGVLMVHDRCRNLENFPELKKTLVMHLILSHHGKFEYGSPVLPATPEALALHHIDNLDAKTVAARKQIDEDPDPEAHWTQRSWMLETRLFKVAPTPIQPAIPQPVNKSTQEQVPADDHASSGQAGSSKQPAPTPGSSLFD